MLTVAIDQKNKIHPHKFTLWVAIGSILMMFAGFTSAYIVKRNQPKWVTFDLPLAFWYSTAAIVLSSLVLYLAKNAFKNRAMPQYRKLILLAFALGVLFLILQIVGFKQLISNQITFTGNVSFSFLYVIVGAHAIHVLGGIIALAVLFARTFNKKVKNYNIIPVEVTSTYWHFVDVLWIYLLLFLIMIK